MTTERRDDNRHGGPAASAGVGSMATGDVVRAAEGWMREELHRYALALHRLAYSLPNGVGERDLLQLSEQMTATAEERVAEWLAPAQQADARAPEMATEPVAATIAQIRAVIPEWPDTNGTPWQLCRTCYVVYDPTAGDAHDHRPAPERRRTAMTRDVVGQARQMVMDRLSIDVRAASALLQQLSTAANTPVEHVAGWLVGADQPAVTAL